MIKRFLSCVILISACTVSGLAENESYVIAPEGLKPVQSFVNDGKGFVYNSFSADSELGTRRYCIYDNDIQLVKDFVTITGTPRGYYRVTQERESKPVKAIPYNEYKRPDPVSIDGVTEGLTIEMIVMQYNGEIATIEDGTKVVCERYYDEQNFQKEYPQRYYKEVDGLWLSIIPCKYFNIF